MISFYTIKMLLGRKVPVSEKVASFSRILKLKIFRALFPSGSLIVPFYKNAYLNLQKGANNAVGNYYAGLLEPDDMLFLTRVLRSGDIFFDVGSNIGSYTVLASKVCGARTVAIEPVPATFAMLRKNIAVNEIESLVTPHNVGVGAQNGKLAFTTEQGGKNYVVLDEKQYAGQTVQVPVVTLDSLQSDPPVMMKIDVEGFELEVLKGAGSLLRNEAVRVLLIEINGLEERYSVSGRAIHDFLLDLGFRSCAYNSRTGELKDVTGPLKHNTLYIRDLAFVHARLSSIGNESSAKK